jgi:hypothetical protein
MFDAGGGDAIARSDAAPPADAGACITGAGSFTSQAFASQTGTFTAEVDVTPAATAVDGGVGIALGAQTEWTGIANIVRFAYGRIEARDDRFYNSLVNLQFSANTTYHVRMVINVATKRYSIYVTPQGAAEVTLGRDYTFRREQLGVSSLDHWIVGSQIGSLRACNFVIR